MSVPKPPSGRDIIVAQASAPGRGGVAVLRLSGTGVVGLAKALAGIEPRPRHAHLVRFRDRAQETLDQGLLLWFPGPHSYTGEDVLELHTHGGEVLPRRVLRACLALGARIAEPGEFTRRAFEHGKLDLAQAEAVDDLIAASGEAAARGALRSLDGAFSRAVRDLQERLTRLRIQAEGGLDFPEEELPLQAAQALRSEAGRVAEAVAALLEEARRSRGVRAGRQVVLLGAPNVGKSSLLNRLAGEDLAIVSSEAGTTRDAVRTQLELGGLRLEFVDTAGVRETQEDIERQGIARTWAAANRADLVIRLHACDQAAEGAPEAPGGVPVLDVWNKSDVLDAERLAWFLSAGGPASGGLLISARTGAGIPELERAMLSALGWAGEVEPGFLARERHIAALELAGQELARAATAVAEELFAEDLRRAQQALDAILGEFAADDLLGEIFARFCIGK